MTGGEGGISAPRLRNADEIRPFATRSGSLCTTVLYQLTRQRRKAASGCRLALMPKGFGGEYETHIARPQRSTELHRHSVWLAALAWAAVSKLSCGVQDACRLHPDARIALSLVLGFKSYSFLPPANASFCAPVLSGVGLDHPPIRKHLFCGSRSKLGAVVQYENLIG